MSKRDLVIVIFVACAVGFVGGIIGGALTGDIHIYIDSFTGPGHMAGDRAPDMNAEMVPGEMK